MEFRQVRILVTIGFLLFQNSNFRVESKETELAKLDKEYELCGGLNLREVTLGELQASMSSPMSPLTSVDLVKCYSARIRTMDPHLHSVVEVNPDAEEIGAKRDFQRRLGIVRSPLHGIPILIKENIGTGDSMETTAGSLALLGIKPKEDAEIVKKLRKAGAVILGKTNLNEFAGFRGTNVPPGWSGRGGQTHNAYVLSQSPSGSSSGSAVAVGANLIPVAIGTETSGSVVLPASVASCVALKPTLGRVPTDGVVPLGFSLDVPGPVTRTVADAAIVFNVIADNPLKSKCFTTPHKKCKVKHLRVGVLREPFWQLPTVKHQLPALAKIMAVLKGEGVDVIDPVQGSSKYYPSIREANLVVILEHELKYGINKYLRTKVKTNFKFVDGKPFWMRNIDDIVAFNDQFPSSEGYNQVYLIESARTDGLENATYLDRSRMYHGGSRDYLNEIFKQYQLNAIMVPTINSYVVPAAAGFPQITIPAGFGPDHIPFGVSLVGLPNTEDTLFRLASRIEKGFPARQTSMFLP